MNPLVSAVMPTLEEAVVLADSLAALSRQEGLGQLVIVDGGSRDDTEQIVEASRAGFAERGIELIRTDAAAGRAEQMNVGASMANGRILLFVHADTFLPEGAVRAVADAVQQGYVGGAFKHRFIEPGFLLSLISRWSNLRSRLTRVFFGDQAIFVRKDEFIRMGGFRPLSIMEDLDFSRRLRSRGRTRLIPLEVRTSARRFLAGGLGATCARMIWLRAAYRLGADPGLLKRHYPEVR